LATSEIRYYESIGLLPEPDRLYGQRRYHTDVLGRLAQKSLSCGFSNHSVDIRLSIREVLPILNCNMDCCPCIFSRWAPLFFAFGNAGSKFRSHA
jgi:DNA-binding transcriptional MerR regulator